MTSLSTTRLLPVLLLLLFSRTAFTSQPEAAYRAQVPVSGQGLEELNGAISQALQKVLVRMTGSRSSAAGEAGRALTGEAAGLVQQYRYEVAPDAVDESQLLLLVQFDPLALDRALHDHGLPVWGAARPTLLLWLGVEQEGQRRFFEPESDTELARVVKEVGAERGISFLLPLMDLEDRNRLRVAELWGGFEEPLRQASERYGAELVLVGRIGSAESSAWQLLHPEQIEEWGNGSLAEGLQEAVDRVAAAYAPQGTTVTAESVLVRIRGIGDMVGIRRVEEFFGAIDAVDTVVLEQIEQDQVLFRLQVRGGAEALARNASLGGVLSAELPDPIYATHDQSGNQADPPQSADLTFRLVE